MASPKGNVSFSDMFNDDINYKRGAIRESVSLLASYSGVSVLDFGCGSAPSREILEACGAKWIGIDDNVGSEASVRCDGHQLPFRDHSFDVILADAVFEHLLEPFQAMKEIARVSKRGGAYYRICCVFRAISYVLFPSFSQGNRIFIAGQRISSN